MSTTPSCLMTQLLLQWVSGSLSAFFLSHSLFCQTYSQVKTKKSNIGRIILGDVKALFQQPEFEDAAKVKAYARWAIRGDGPGFYAKPTPMECTLQRNDPKYIVRRPHFQLDYKRHLPMPLATWGLLSVIVHREDCQEIHALGWKVCFYNQAWPKASTERSLWPHPCFGMFLLCSRFNVALTSPKS